MSVAEKSVKSISTTKNKILNESLELFASKGFEGVSVRDIADRVGIRNSALYKHFETKQAILDTLVEEISEHYQSSLFDISRFVSDKKELKEACSGLFRLLTEDKEVSCLLRILSMEQYSNPTMAVYFNELFIKLPLATTENMAAHVVTNPRVTEKSGASGKSRAAKKTDSKKSVQNNEFSVSEIALSLYSPILALACSQLGTKRGTKELPGYFETLIEKI